jgi:hypothetical protein
MDKSVHARQPSPRAVLKAAGAYLFFFIGFWMLALIGVALGTDLYKTVRELIHPEENDRAPTCSPMPTVIWRSSYIAT